MIKKLEKDHADIYRLSLEDIKKELDKNIKYLYFFYLYLLIKVNDIIVLLNRRKALISNKKRKMKNEYE